jgi:hypothetical protein
MLCAVDKHPYYVLYLSTRLSVPDSIHSAAESHLFPSNGGLISKRVLSIDLKLTDVILDCTQVGFLHGRFKVFSTTIDGCQVPTCQNELNETSHTNDSPFTGGHRIQDLTCHSVSNVQKSQGIIRWRKSRGSLLI